VRLIIKSNDQRSAYPRIKYSVPSSARRPSSEYMNAHAISFRMIRTPWSRVVWRPCLLGKRACPGPRRLWPAANASNATTARKSSVPDQLAGCAVRYPGVYSSLSITAIVPSARPGFDGVTSHYFRKTVATLMDEAACRHIRLPTSLGTRNPR